MKLPAMEGVAGMPSSSAYGPKTPRTRVAVEWAEDGTIRDGVFIPRRDSNSRFNALFGGRLFPGVHHHTRFQVSETEAIVDVQMRSTVGSVGVAVRGRRSSRLPDDSVFGSVERASVL